MSDETIRAALEAAAMKLAMRRGEHASWSGAMADATWAIVAFHMKRARDLDILNSPGAAQEHRELAAAVERAAKEAGDG